MTTDRIKHWTIEMAEAWEREVAYLMSRGMSEDRAEETAFVSIERQYSRELMQGASER